MPPRRGRFPFLKDQFSQFLLGVDIVRVNHGVGDVAVPEGHLDQAQVLGFLIKLNGKGVAQRMELLGHGSVKLPDLVQTVVTDAENVAAVLLRGESVEAAEKVGMKGDFPVIGVLKAPDKNTFIVSVEIHQSEV